MGSMSIELIWPVPSVVDALQDLTQLDTVSVVFQDSDKYALIDFSGTRLHLTREGDLGVVAPAISVKCDSLEQLETVSSLFGVPIRAGEHERIVNISFDSGINISYILSGRG